jgi:hypothetical protein
METAASFEARFAPWSYPACTKTVDFWSRYTKASEHGNGFGVYASRLRCWEHLAPTDSSSHREWPGGAVEEQVHSNKTLLTDHGTHSGQAIRPFRAPLQLLKHNSEFFWGLGVNR